jgi:hypothetical protein
MASTPETTYPRVLRLVVLLGARAGLDDASLTAGVRELARSCARRLGPDAVLRPGVRLPEDPLAAMLGDRDAPGHVDAIVEASLPASSDPDRLVAALDGLGAELDAVAEPGTVALMAGPTYLVWPDDGRLVLALAARRDPAITVEELQHWWLEQHAVLIQEVVRPRALGYDQLHVDAELSRRASDSAGLPYAPFDMFDSIDIDTVTDVTESTLMEPQTAQRLYQDELGHVDHTSMRGALCSILTPAAR